MCISKLSVEFPIGAISLTSTEAVDGDQVGVHDVAGAGGLEKANYMLKYCQLSSRKVVGIEN